jgi:NAD(P)-dependent dehydrogenase (short-subunit alcohol dehydrogenase family)
MTKLALVTAGTSAIGSHLVAGLAANGYHIAYTHLPGETAPPETATTKAFASDTGDEAQVAEFHAAAAAWAGVAPWVMVCNAGIQTWSSLLDLKVGQWDRVIETNLRGLFLNTQTAARAMIAAGIKGNIITLGSGCNKLAFPRLVDYTTSKGGIEQFTKVAASELGPHGIRVNCIAPGAIETDRTKAEAPDYAATWAPLTPLRRIGTPQDLVGPLLFLISDAASFITGQTLTVDGGTFSQAPWPYPVLP